jgi:hypothetical protein
MAAIPIAEIAAEPGWTGVRRRSTGRRLCRASDLRRRIWWNGDADRLP